MTRVCFNCKKNFKGDKEDKCPYCGVKPLNYGYVHPLLGPLLIFGALLELFWVGVETLKQAIGVIWIIIMGIYFCLKSYFAPENVKRREEVRINREAREQATQIEGEYEKEQREYEYQREKEREVARYQQLRKEIEAMPQYQHWRQSVFEKFGRKCAVCGSTENLEVDHRYKSFYSIIKEYRITDTIQAYECSALWDVNNGAPLCKEHHDQTASSVYYRNNNST